MKINRKLKLVFDHRSAVTLENTALIGHRRRCPSVTLEPAVFLGDNTCIEAGFIGMGTSIGSNTQIKFTHSVGRFTTIGYNCMIGTKNSPPKDRISSSVIVQDRKGIWYQDFLQVKTTYPFVRRNRIKIGNDVWIGDCVSIAENVAIGNGAIIESGSVVSEDVPAYAVVKGNPAQITGFRFERDVIQRLEKVMWWNYGLNLLEEAPLPDLSAEELVSYLEQMRKEKPKVPYGQNGFLLVTEEKANSIYRLNHSQQNLLYRLSDRV